jgi:hypothetical protein
MWLQLYFPLKANVNVLLMNWVDIMATSVNICGISWQDGEILNRIYKNNKHDNQQIVFLRY